MALHTLQPERATLHGQFSPDLPPALVVDSGDTVRYRTLDVSWGMEQHGAPGTPRRKFEPRTSPLDDGPALCGPVAVRGALPGMTLEIQILHLRPAPWGWTYAGPSPFTDRLRARLGLADAAPVLIRWRLDLAAMRAKSEAGLHVPIRPFLGIVGLAPGEPGLHSGWLPGRTGGNMDCRELVAGSRLFLPVAAPGALASVGDGHAAQGDGEVGGTAIECAMDRVDVRLLLHEGLAIEGPRAHTPAGWITLGFGPTLDEAAADALDAMIGWIAAATGRSRAEALALASVAVDLRVTQLVNGTVGAHALLPRGVIEGLPELA